MARAGARGRHRRAFAPGYGRLWGATAASGLGDGTRLAAMALYAADLTHDPLQVAVVTVAGKLPWALVGPVSGALADRLEPWRALWICDAARMVVTGLLVLTILTGHAGIPALAVASFLLTSITTLADNLTQAVVPEMSGGMPLEGANSRLLAGQMLAGEFLGAPLGAALYAVGRSLPFALDTLTFALSAVLVCGVRAPAGHPRRVPAARPFGVRDVLAGTAEGVRWLWRHRLLRTLCLAGGLLNFSVVAVLGIAVLYALQVLGISERGYGVFLVLLAVGGLAGVLLAPAVSRALGQGRTLRYTFALCPVPFLVAGSASEPLLAVGVMTLVGAAISVVTVVTTSLRQQLIPPELFGRVNGAYRTVVNGVSPLGGLAGGLAADLAGLRAPFFLAAALVGVAALMLVAGLPAGLLRKAPATVPSGAPVARSLRTLPRTRRAEEQPDHGHHTSRS